MPVRNLVPFYRSDISEKLKINTAGSHRNNGELWAVVDWTDMV